MGGIDWVKWQEEQDRNDGPNARKPQKTDEDRFKFQRLTPSEPSADFPDTVDD